MNKYFKLIFFLLFAVTSSQAQSISVIFIEGDVKITSAMGKADQAVNLVYGPVSENKKLILAEHASVKLIKEDGNVCHLSKPGSYLIKDLVFDKSGGKSTISSFVDYFTSFFEGHPNSESKEKYKNSISAISKGHLGVPPILEFPFPGNLPLVKNSLLFSWGSRCDSCTYKLVIQDVSSKIVVFEKISKEQSYMLNNPQDYLKVNTNYVWYIQMIHANLNSIPQLFTASDPKDYTSKIKDLEKTLTKGNKNLSPTSKLAGIYGALEREQLTNHMIIYGREQLKKYPKDTHLAEIYDRVYYDNLRRARY